MLLLLACHGLLFTPTPRPTVHPAIRTAFERQDHKGVGEIEAPAVRRALAELGADVSNATAHRLVATYGDSMDVRALATIVDRAAVASPVHFWLAVDPAGTGLRRTRLGWNRFARAGTLTPVRLAHYGVGLASLTVGTYDVADYVAHLGVPELAYSDATAHAVLHTAAAFLSLPRFRYRRTKDKPLHLWMPTARDANMWPSAILYTWYTLSMLSTFVRPPADAVLACDAPAFVAFTWFTSAAMLYGTARTVLETDEASVSGVYATRLSNVLQVAFTMSLPVLADTGKCIFVSHDPVVYAAYTHTVATFPSYTQTYLGSCLSAMYLGNLACALSSAEHHNAITKRQIGDLINALNVVVNAAVVTGICRVDGLAWSMIAVTWDGALSFLR